MQATGYKNGVAVLQISKPAITQADADAYAGSIDSLVVKDGPTYTPTVPAPDPLSQVKTMQKSREEIAREAILDCKGKAFLALVAGGMSQEAANEAGTDLVVQHSALISAYEVAGGNAKAKAAFIAAIVADPPAWWGPAFLAIFEDAL